MLELGSGVMAAPASLLCFGHLASTRWSVPRPATTQSVSGFALVVSSVSDSVCLTVRMWGAGFQGSGFAWRQSLIGLIARIGWDVKGPGGWRRWGLSWMVMWVNAAVSVDWAGGR